MKKLIKIMILAGIVMPWITFNSIGDPPPPVTSTEGGYNPSAPNAFADFEKEPLGSLLVFGLPSIPYLIMLTFLFFAANPVLVFPAAAIALCFDTFVVFTGVFMQDPSGAAAGLISAPFINLLFALPAGLATGWLLTKFGPFRTVAAET